MKKLYIILLLAIIGLRANAQIAYITNSGDNTVSVINVATNTVTAIIPVGDFPDGVSVSQDGSKVYVANWEGNSVSVINTATNTVTATIPVGSYPSGICVSPDGSKVYVTNQGDNNVGVINTATNTVSATIAAGDNTMCVAVSPDGSKVYVGNYVSNSLSVINSATNTVTATIPIGKNPQGIAVSPDGSKIYVANSGANTVDVISSITNTISTIIAVGIYPDGVALSPDGSKIYVANSNSSSVSVINAARDSVIATIIVGDYPDGVTVSPDGSKVYAANMNSNTVSVISTATNTVTETIMVGNEPTSCGNFISTYPNPLVTISASVNPICIGETTTLTAIGATTYSWSSGLGSANSITVTPASTTTYTVAGTTTGGTGSADIAITVNPYLTNTIIGPSSICSGDNVILNAGAGYSTYIWSTGRPTQTDTVIIAGTYTVTVSIASGCTGSASITLNDSPLPIVSITPTHANICQGQYIGLSAAGGSMYQWSPSSGLSCTACSDPMASPDSTTTYTVTAISASECSTTDTVTVYVEIPNITISANPDTICSGDCSTLTALGGFNYMWSNGEGMGNQIVVCPATTTSYTVTAMYVNGCEGQYSYSITVYVSICTGLAESSIQQEVLLIPNPATSNVTIETTQQASIEIFNIQGQLIKTIATTGNKTSIDVSGLPSGVYVVEVKTEKGVSVEKFIKE